MLSMTQLFLKVWVPLGPTSFGRILRLLPVDINVGNRRVCSYDFAVGVDSNSDGSTKLEFDYETTVFAEYIEVGFLNLISVTDLLADEISYFLFHLFP